MTKRYAALRKAIKCTPDMTQAIIAQMLGITIGALVQKLNGRIPWKLWEAYTIMDALRLPIADIKTYFPDKEDEP